MRRVALLASLLGLLLPLTAGAQHRLTYLGPLGSTIDVSAFSPPSGDCILGNRQSVVQYSEGGDWPYILAYPCGHSTQFAPWDGGCPCSSGYYFSDLHFVFACVSESPVDIALKLDLAAGPRRDDPLGYGLSCPWTPGLPSLYVDDTISQPGYYELTVCTSGWACAKADYYYGFTVAGDLSDQPSLRFALDGGQENPLGDIRWATISVNFLRFATGFAGSIICWSNVVCCEFPVPVEDMSWGKIKALYD